MRPLTPEGYIYSSRQSIRQEKIHLFDRLIYVNFNYSRAGTPAPTL
jgi:hypothetical protein